MATVLATILALGLLVGCGSSAPAPAATSKPAAEAPKAAATAPTQAPVAAAPTAAPAPAKPYFEGKNINVIVPNSAGGGIDTVARYTAAYVKKHAGAKDIIVENKVGAAGIKGMNELWVAKPDGLTIGFASLVTLTLQQLSGQEGVQFDPVKFNYLGRAYREPRVVMASAKSDIKSMQDVLKLGRPVVMPIQGLDDESLSMTVIAKQLGIQIKHITGFAGQAEVFLAVMRGEGDLCTTGFRTADPMIKQGDMRPIMVIGAQKISEYPDVPLATDVVTSAEGKALLNTVSELIELQMSYIAPPKMDDKVVAELRSAVSKALQDPEAVANAAAKAGKREIVFMSGEQEQKVLEKVAADAQKIVPILKEGVAAVR
ncbi:MAG: Bug family tripartite tricarboxylate transporter substrate binding protein [Chloroflexota bacterium]